jgi:hypothetical protein
MRTAIHQAELYSMDDIMPVFILVLVRSSLSRPFASARFMYDALSQARENRHNLKLHQQHECVLILLTCVTTLNIPDP